MNDSVLSKILDGSHDLEDGDEISGFDPELEDASGVIRSLDRNRLLKLVKAIALECDLVGIIKQEVPEAYTTFLSTTGQPGEVTGIPLLPPAPSSTGEPQITNSNEPTNWTTQIDSQSSTHTPTTPYYTKIAKFAPLRLSHDERKLMRLLDSTLHVSEYTDKIDVLCEGSKARRIVKEIKEVCAILSGLMVAHNYEIGQALLRNRDYESNAEFFKYVFEIGRRYKILNPDRMRSSYGKLIYFLMDSRKGEVGELLGFDIVAPVRTVYGFLERRGGLEVLGDGRLGEATMEITPEGRSRAEIQRLIQRKEEAIRYLTKKYSVRKLNSIINYGLSFLSGSYESPEETLTEEELLTCLYSLGDHHAHLQGFRRPCDEMIKHLKTNFDPSESNPKYNLSINAGHEGSRLSHGHSRQFTYVLQSLTLWREIANDMFALWHYAEADLLDPDNPYRLRNTGQGLNRVQEAPNVLAAMRGILRRVQGYVGSWVGSNVVHLGDHNVPNAFVFIDKYTQVPRILSPIVSTLAKLPELYTSTPAMKQYIDVQFAGPENLKMAILTDFFRHAFDGSGADNFNDAGSCIDGRLTSAWNWCSKIESKPYFPIFLLCSFYGFDGRFSDE